MAIENEDLELKTEAGEGGEGESKNEKPELTPDQIQGIKKRQFTKLAKELGIELPKPESEQKVEKTKTGFDYGEKAFLKASGIQSNEYDFIQEVMQNTGKSLDDVLESKYFQAELKERRETQATKEAVPSGTKRASASTKDTVEYWIAKGELPPDRELRAKVVKAKIKIERSKSQFTDNPIV